MADIFGNDQKMPGCYHRVSRPFLGRGAVVYLPATPGVPRPMIWQAPYFVTGIRFAEKEKYHLVQCFDDKTYTYAFGHDPAASMVEVEILAFLTSIDGARNSDAFTTWVRNYNTNRLYKQQQYTKVTIASQALYGFLVGMSSGTRDPHFELQSFELTLIAVEAQAGGGDPGGGITGPVGGGGP